MKSKLQKGLIALLIAAFLGCISACGMFEWTDRTSTDSETTSSMEESESVNSDKTTDGEGETSDKTENEQPQPDVEKPSEDSTQGGGENSDGAEDEKSSDGKVELPEDKFD